MSPQKGYMLNQARALLQGKKPSTIGADAAQVSTPPAAVDDRLLSPLRRRRGNGLASSALGIRA